MTQDLSRADEVDLIKKALHRDGDAFGELASRYEKSLFNVVYGVVSDIEMARDVTQESFLRAYRFLARYQLRFRFSTWLFRIGVNLAISKLRRAKLEHDAFSVDGIVEHGLMGGEAYADPADGLMHRERGELLMQAIRELSERYRTVVLMRYRDGMSCRDIGRELGLSANSVSIILHRSKMKLREVLGEDVAN
jgi:RNA polymerase sigma-70 factor, ECF subfamily